MNLSAEQTVNINETGKKRVMRRHEEIIKIIQGRDSQLTSEGIRRHILATHKLYEETLEPHNLTLGPS